MSAVIADPTAGAVPPKRGRKKLLVFAAAGLVLAVALAGGAVYFLKQRAAHAAAAEAGDDDGGAGDHAAARIDPKNVPVYLPLDPFVVNLADKEADRYAQIGVTFELESGSSVEELKAYMPSIRNAILMVLANKTSRELIDRAGKEQLAQDILREAVRPMGIEIASAEPIGMEPAASAVIAMAASAPAIGASAAAMVTAEAAKPRPKARHMAQKNPIRLVHFSSFIIQ